LALTAGCDDTVFNGNEPASGIFLEDVLEIIDSNCLECHAGLTAEAGLDLSTDFCGSVMTGGIVVPENPDSSLLYQRMRSPSDPMPPSGRLPTTDLDVVRQWIIDGAECDGVSWTGDVDTGDSSDPGKQLYDAYCAGCHGADGGGNNGPAMASVVPGLTAQEVADIARSGSGGMPPVLGDPGDGLLVGEFCVEQWGP
jgi:hypothetical protein